MFQKYLVRKILIHRRGHKGFVEIFLSHNGKNFRSGTLLCFRKFPVWQMIMDDRWGGMMILRWKFFVSQCLNASWGNHSLFRKIWGLEEFIES